MRFVYLGLLLVFLSPSAHAVHLGDGGAVINPPITHEVQEGILCSTGSTPEELNKFSAKLWNDGPHGDFMGRAGRKGVVLHQEIEISGTEAAKAAGLHVEPMKIILVPIPVQFQSVSDPIAGSERECVKVSHVVSQPDLSEALPQIMRLLSGSSRNGIVEDIRMQKEDIDVWVRDNSISVMTRVPYEPTNPQSDTHLVLAAISPDGVIDFSEATYFYEAIDFDGMHAGLAVPASTEAVHEHVRVTCSAIPRFSRASLRNVMLELYRPLCADLFNNPHY